MTATVAREQPVNLILSGPAGGVIGAAWFSRIIDEPNLITIDMGGTSLDASLILDGDPVLYQGAELEGLPVNISSLYIHTIGAGGGSIAWLDGAGALQVGPQSAGAVPGPASYAAGGTEPTFTDAALVLGYLGAETPLAGTLVLDYASAQAALEPQAEQLGMSVGALAKGIVRISSTKIMGAVRTITVELGRDPKDFSLLSFGGAGGLVAVDVANELGIPKVIVPPGQGTFSALGMLMADVQHDLARTSVLPLARVDVKVMQSSFAEMQDEATKLLDSDGFGPSQMVFARTVDVRYSGQEHSVTVGLASDASDPLQYLEEEFTKLHRRHYGHTMTDPVEITILRLRGTGLVEKPSIPVLEERDSDGPSPMGERAVYVSDQEPPAPYALYAREDLKAGDVIGGPAVVAEHTATTVLHREDVLRVGRYGELVITLKESRHD